MILAIVFLEASSSKSHAFSSISACRMVLAVIRVYLNRKPILGQFDFQVPQENEYLALIAAICLQFYGYLGLKSYRCKSFHLDIHLIPTRPFCDANQMLLEQNVHFH